MKSKIKMATALFVLLIAASATQAAQLEIEVKDSPDSPGSLLIQVSQAFASSSIPAPAAQIKITDNAAFSRALTADLMGRAFIPLQDLAAAAQSGASALTISASGGGQQAQLSYQLVPADIHSKILAAMKLLGQRGKSQTDAKDYAGAEKTYRQMGELDPTSKAAFYNLGLAYEKDNHPREAIAAYLQYLTCPGSASDNQVAQIRGLRRQALLLQMAVGTQFSVMEKIISLEKTLSPRLAIPADAQAQFKQASDLAAAGNMTDALTLYEKIELTCPWWAEPYYAAGITAEYLTYHRDFSYIDRAIQNFDLFLDAAGPEDQARVNDVKARHSDLAAVKSYPPAGAR